MFICVSVGFLNLKIDRFSNFKTVNLYLHDRTPKNNYHFIMPMKRRCNKSVTASKNTGATYNDAPSYS